MPVPFQVWHTRKSSVTLPSHAKSKKFAPIFCGTVTDCVISPGIERIDHGAVGRRRGGDIAHRIQARRARHVLHDDVRLARDVAADVAREHARVVVVTAARRETDDDADRLAFVEIRDVLRGSRSGEQGKGGKRP